MSTHPHFLGSMTLKALLEDPNLKNPPVIESSVGTNKIKKENGSDGPQYNYGSAFLGPNLWDKSYGMDINLEYMDLEEFLSENVIGESDNSLKGIVLDTPVDDLLSGGASSPPDRVVSSPRQYLRTPPLSPSQFITGSSSSKATPSQPATAAPIPPLSPYPLVGSPQDSQQSTKSASGSFSVDFHVSDQDLALTTVPGVSFDPRKHNFTDEDLKPQPIIKKSRKVFVPEDLKDDKYWARRHKNNFAAKRSRDARRVKENQIALRAAYLEKENKCLKEEMAKLQKENTKLIQIAEKYEPGSVSSSSETWSVLSP